MSKVEDVARVICAVRGLDPDADWRVTELENGYAIICRIEVENPENWRRYTKEAVAVINAIREPSEGMAYRGRLAGQWKEDSDGTSTEGNASEVFQAMIDEALKE